MVARSLASLISLGLYVPAVELSSCWACPWATGSFRLVKSRALSKGFAVTASAGFTLSSQLQVRSWMLVMATLNFRTEKTKGLSEDGKKQQGIKQSDGKRGFF